MPTSTPNYGLIQPDIDGSSDVWGELLNQDLVTIDTLLFNRVRKDPGGGAQIMENALVLNQQPGQTTENGITDHSAATVGYVEARLLAYNGVAANYTNTRICAYLNAMFPVYSIILWRGTGNGPWPPGWAPCNGGVYDGVATPDLHDRVVLGFGTRGDSGSYPANPSWNFEHKHNYAQFNTGPGDNNHLLVYYLSDADPNTRPPGWPPLSEPGINFPYYVLVYLMKTRNVVPGDA
jgi:hypothetical protein